jgi:phosphoribosylformimino-5-aminoimidazole carboxamide ribotide isomerase
MPDTDFIIFPAIDLRSGQVVRLKEGDPNRQTHYSQNPAEIARRWVDAGAQWLHVVNLDGAFDQPDAANRRALDAILSAAGQANVRVQFGGGLRSIEAIAAALDAGVSRAIIGTLAVEQPQLMAEALERWGAEQVGASLDARDGLVKVRGWQDSTPLRVDEAAQALKQSGLRWLVFTDISRDGLQTGLNLPATASLAEQTGLNVIASGGVHVIDDVNGARDAHLAGVIVGRALYEGSIDSEQLFR